jgi:hypothetical protein
MNFVHFLAFVLPFVATFQIGYRITYKELGIKNSISNDRENSLITVAGTSIHL